MKFKVAERYDPGKESKINEDSYSYNKDLGLFIVADGLGGYAGGDIASKMAVKSVIERLEKSLTDIKMTQEEVKKEISDSFMEANDRIIYEREKDNSIEKMGTTLSLVLIRDDGLYMAYVGNSRIYVLCEGADFYKNPLEEDDSPVEAAFDKEEIEIETAITSHERSIIKRYLGKERGLKPTIRLRDVKPVEKVLLATDGLTDNALQDEIGEIMVKNSPEEGVEKLLYIAKNPEKVAKIYADYYEKNKAVLGFMNMSYEKALKQLGGKDNITMIMVELIK